MTCTYLLTTFVLEPANPTAAEPSNADGSTNHHPYHAHIVNNIPLSLSAAVTACLRWSIWYITRARFGDTFVPCCCRTSILSLKTYELYMLQCSHVSLGYMTNLTARTSSIGKMNQSHGRLWSS
ncbi:hypothetical protein M433DRAFT_304900 [Acidomyces richmondensis BFW]|nr:hypothetical protein M433DRAFT_304900 [Acidomyces richmondensis BFW]